MDVDVGSLPAVLAGCGSPVPTRSSSYVTSSALFLLGGFSGQVVQTLAKVLRWSGFSANPNSGTKKVSVRSALVRFSGTCEGSFPVRSGSPYEFVLQRNRRSLGDFGTFGAGDVMLVSSGSSGIGDLELISGSL